MLVIVNLYDVYRKDLTRMGHSGSQTGRALSPPAWLPHWASKTESFPCYWYPSDAGLTRSDMPVQLYLQQRSSALFIVVPTATGQHSLNWEWGQKSSWDRALRQSMRMPACKSQLGQMQLVKCLRARSPGHRCVRGTCLKACRCRCTIALPTCLAQ
jgi:hypothetical protein